MKKKTDSESGKKPAASKKTARVRARKSTRKASETPPYPFPVAAIGASAGGLAAFMELLGGLPSNVGMGYVLLQHLEPKHESALPLLLARSTRMPVVEAGNGMKLEADHVYVVPPNKAISIRKGRLRLSPRKRTGMVRLIDDFFVSLAEDAGSSSIGVVLSGSGSDGTYGLKAIKAAGGATFVQDPQTAEWPPMPLSAISSGVADVVLPPKDIAKELVRLSRHPYVKQKQAIPEGQELERICLHLLSAVGIDFRLYKSGTVRRRIARRMALRKASSLADYELILKQDPEEARSLADDIFIHVTGFFRDVESFRVLQKRVLRKLCQQQAPDAAIRIWVPGCSTGEEVYSIAILLLEELGNRAAHFKIQIFGTDIHAGAVDRARTALYTPSAVAGVSQARLARFFHKTEQGYQIQRRVRELCVFAQHDLATDPPFTSLDLISCRNVLIYMDVPLQRRVLAIFQYALKPMGCLFLGYSESIGSASVAFEILDQKHKIYTRKASAAHLPVAHTLRGQLGALAAPPPKVRPAGTPFDLRKGAEAILLQQYAPPSLVVDSDHRIVHFQGDMSPFLAPATGQPSFHLLRMLNPDLVTDVRTAIQAAVQSGELVQRESIPTVIGGQPAVIQLDVRPLPAPAGERPDLLVVFQKRELKLLEKVEDKVPAGARGQAEQELRRLRRELETVRDHMRNLIADHERSEEEMKVAHEEILSSNEELQSTIEEMETAKEELQSANEELLTVNDELEHTNIELQQTTQDLNNLLSGINIPVLVLDNELRVRRFTPVAGELLNLIPGDIGRPFTHIASTLVVDDWKQIFQEVLRRGLTVDREVQGKDGRRYSLRARPNRSVDGGTEGVLVVLLDVDDILQARDEARWSYQYVEAILSTIREALVVLDSDLRVQRVNERFCEMFRKAAPDVYGKPFPLSGEGALQVAGLRERLLSVSAGGEEIDGMEVSVTLEKAKKRSLLVNVGRLEIANHILVAMQDITERRQAQELLKAGMSMIATLLESSTQAIVALDPQNRILMVNKATEETFGYAREELNGQPFDVLLEAGEEGNGAAAYRKTVAERSTATGLEFSAQRKNGEKFPAEADMRMGDRATMELKIEALKTIAGELYVVFIRDTSERKRLQESEKQHFQEMEELAGRLLEVQEEERRTISRDLHDQICQQMAAIAMDMGGLAEEAHTREEVERLRELQARVTRTSEETHDIALQLHSSILDDLGLEPSLKGLIIDFQRQTGIAVKFRKGRLPAGLPQAMALCLYRVAQEALQNIARHAGAKHVSVSTGRRKGTAVLTITDDGRGFDPDEVRGRGRLGLVGMEERVRLVGGTLAINSSPGKGTEIRAEVPLQ